MARGNKGKKAAKAASQPRLPEHNDSDSSSQKGALDVPWTCSGVLASQPLSRDLKIGSFTLLLHGKELIVDAKLDLNYGQRYGLIGLNGTGKSTMLKAIANGDLPIPKHFDMHYLDREFPPSDRTALQAIIDDLQAQHSRIEKEISDLSMEDPENENLEYLYEALDNLEIETAEKRAGEILHGLGFTKSMQNKKTKEFSGGWRMRIALARALFYRPTILLLDEPTNHLDLNACVWLEEYLRHYNHILLLISHSQDFLNHVCTNIIHLSNKKLTVYGGNYDTYIRTRAELEENQMKRYKWEQDQMNHIKDYIARFGHGSAKLARQAKSREKTLARMQDSGLTEKVVKDQAKSFFFQDPGDLSGPIIQFTEVSFGYHGRTGPQLYKKIDFGVDLDSRIALVGPNGAGKSTLLKLMVGDLEPTDGLVRRHSHLRIGYYHQHLADLLDLDLSPLQYMMKCFPEAGEDTEQWRRQIGRFGITGHLQVSPIKILSDGIKSRLVFAWLAYKQPHILLLDEPTNHLDLETIDCLADAINDFEGGVVLVSHDFRLISQVAEEIWEVGGTKKGGVTKWNGDILSYKKHLRHEFGLDD